MATYSEWSPGWRFVEALLDRLNIDAGPVSSVRIEAGTRGPVELHITRPLRDEDCEAVLELLATGEPAEAP